MICGDDGCPPFEGVLGSAPVPGSTEVLDKATGRMEPCNSQRCPFATEKETLNGTVLVNFAPVSISRAGAGGGEGFGGLTQNKQYASGQSVSASISSKTTGPDPVFAFLAERPPEKYGEYARYTETVPAFPDGRKALGAMLVNSTNMTAEEWQMYEDVLSSSLDFENVAMQVNAECRRLLGGCRGLTPKPDCQVPSLQRVGRELKRKHAYLS